MNKFLMLVLSTVWFQSLGQTTNMVQRLRWLAQTENREAQAKLGIFLVSSNEPAFTKEGLEWLRRSASAGNTNAIFHLAEFLNNQREFEIVYDESGQWLTRAGQMGIGSAYFRYGRILECRGFKKQAIPVYRNALALGVKEANSRLGWIYISGAPGVPYNEQIAFQYFEAGKDFGGMAVILRGSNSRDRLIEAYKYARLQQYNGPKDGDQAVDINSLAGALTLPEIQEGDRRFKDYIEQTRLSEPAIKLRGL